jgi:hypothetical protein
VTHPHTKALAELVERSIRDRTELAHNGGGTYDPDSDPLVIAARAALALPQEQAPGAEPVTDAAWEVTNQGRYIYCDRFEHDIRLTIDGDFESDAERVAFAKACAVKLCSAPSSPGAAEAGETVAGEKLWLWKNGDHYLAYRHLYPCFTPGGDPMTLGEPVGYALIRESHDRATPSKPHFMSMEAAQNRATQREHGRIDGMVGALKKIQEERKAEAEARPVGEEYALLRELVDAEDAQDAMRMAHPATRQMISAEEAHAVGDRVDKAWIAARQALSAAPREAVPRGYVRADEAMSVHQLFDDLCDVVAEANAADTVMGRPEVLRSKLIKIRDAVGDAVNGYIPFAAPAAPREVAGWKWMPPEATPEMIAAVEDRSDRLWSTGAVYRAMFSAAPQEGTT